MTNGDEGRQERLVSLLTMIRAYEDEVDNIDRRLRNLADRETSMAEFLAAARQMYELEMQAPLLVEEERGEKNVR